MKILEAAQKYLTNWPVSYSDQLFVLLYHDVEGEAQSIAKEIFEQARSPAFYGSRGVGKTTLMQGVLWFGLKNHASKDNKFLPVNVVITGANTVSNLAEMEEKFYRTVLEGLYLASTTDEKLKKLNQMLGKIVPWIGSAALTAAGLVFPPAALGSEAVRMILKKLVEKMGLTSVETLISSKEIDPKSVVNKIIQELGEENVVPVFTIDELDKVSNENLLSDFFEGQQGWFQGKRCLISLSLTYGESLKDATIHSVKRFCNLKKIDGVTKQKDFNEIIQKRFLLGISEIEENESTAKGEAINIFPNEISTQIVNNFAPHVNLMLEESYNGIRSALDQKCSYVSMNNFPSIAGVELKKPTNQEKMILDELSEGGKQPSVLADILGKKRSVISRSLTKMETLDWVGKVGTRPRKYFIKQKGESARHRNN